MASKGFSLERHFKVFQNHVFIYICYMFILYFRNILIYYVFILYLPVLIMMINSKTIWFRSLFLNLPVVGKYFR